MKKIVTIIILATFSLPVYADGCCGPIVSAINSARAVLVQISGELRQTSSDIVKAINQEGNAQMQAIIETMDAKNVQDVENAKATKRYEAVKESRPAVSECIGRGVSAFSGDMERGMRESAKELARYNKLIASRGVGGGVSASQAASIHKIKYCDKDTDPTNCLDTPPISNEYGAAHSMAGADTDARSVTEGFAGSGNGTRVMTPAQIEAAQVYIQHATGGNSVPRRLNKSEADTEAGKRYEAARLEYEAMSSASKLALQQIVASQAPLNGSEILIDALEKSAVGEKSEKWIKSEIQKLKNNPQPIKGKLSYAELLRLESSRRFANPGWYEDIQDLNDAVPLLRELIHIQATSLYLQHQQMLRDEVKAVTDANAATTVVGNKLHELRELESRIALIGQSR